MTRLTRAIEAQRRRLAGDSGTSLVLALIFITVVAVVMGVVLSLAETNLRTTTAMRVQAANAAAADGAAKIAINRLRTSGYDGTGDCFGADGKTLTLANFTTSASMKSTTAVSCVEDPTKSAIADINLNNRPANALLTLGKPGDTDLSAYPGYGIYAKINGNKGADIINVKGGVLANSNINIFHGTLKADGTTQALGTCSGDIQPACTHPAEFAAKPDYGLPAPPTVDRSNVPACKKKEKNIVPFEAGLYTDVDKLNAAMSCPGLVYWFKPGTYFFDFPKDTDLWEIGAGYVIGGWPTGSFDTNNPPGDIGSACESPVGPVGGGAWSPPAQNRGVTFVFGGQAKMRIQGDANVALCGNYTAGRPPVVIHGLENDLTAAIGTVHGQANANNCLFERSCALITTNKNDNFQAYLFGTVYAPLDWVDLSLKKQLQFYFLGGVVVHHFSVDGPGNTGTPTPMVAIPDRSAIPSHTVVWLNVYVCPGASSCPTTGTPALRAKVNITEDRDVTVLNWSVQR